MDSNATQPNYLLRLSLLIVLVLAASSAHLVLAIAIVGLSAVSSIVFLPFAWLVGRLCTRFGISSRARQALIITPVLVLAVWIWSFSNRFGGYRDHLLRHGLSRLPAQLSIEHYDSRAGFMAQRAEFDIRCSSESLRAILESPVFQRQMHGIKPPGYLPSPSPPPERSASIHYERHQGGMTCRVTTDAHFDWAHVHYYSGN